MCGKLNTDEHVPSQGDKMTMAEHNHGKYLKKVLEHDAIYTRNVFQETRKNNLVKAVCLQIKQNEPQLSIQNCRVLLTEEF